jgi:FMN phosphatase YigB (HAD superfamily)
LILEAITFDFADTLFPHRPRELRSILERSVDFLRSHLPPFQFADFERKFLEVRDRQFAENRATLQENDFPQRLRESIAHDAPHVAPDEALIRGCVEAYAEAFVSVMAMPPFLPELFARLAQQYRLCLISNYPLTEPITRTLERDGLMPYLSGVVISADLGVIKPHPLLFETALARLGSPPPERVVHVGDDWDADIVGAGRCGLHTVYTRQWRDHPDRHYGKGDLPPLAEIDDLRDLQALLERLAASAG